MVLEGTRDGITDIGFEPTIFHPDKLPLEQITFVTPFANVSRTRFTTGSEAAPLVYQTANRVMVAPCGKVTPAVKQRLAVPVLRWPPESIK